MGFLAFQGIGVEGIPGMINVFPVQPFKGRGVGKVQWIINAFLTLQGEVGAPLINKGMMDDFLPLFYTTKGCTFFFSNLSKEG